MGIAASALLSESENKGPTWKKAVEPKDDKPKLAAKTRIRQAGKTCTLCLFHNGHTLSNISISRRLIFRLFTKVYIFFSSSVSKLRVARRAREGNDVADVFQTR